MHTGTPQQTSLHTLRRAFQESVCSDSGEKAVKIVKSGDWVDYGWCTGTPDALDKALARRTDELKDVNVRGGILLKPLAILEREDAGEHFT